MVLLAVSAAFVVTALAFDHITLANGTTEQYRLMVRLASAFALAAVVVVGFWFLRAPKPRRLQWLWPVITVGVFVFSMFEYGARGR
jgi:multisubunit Na+/H+ antiporter MnhB subunit